jgi:hypothetical protein
MDGVLLLIEQPQGLIGGDMIDPSEESARTKREGSRRASEIPASLPDAGVFTLGSPGARPNAAIRSELTTTSDPSASYNLIFETLVTSEDDLVGFVAYGLYKQSKRDWFIAFAKEHRRAPNAVEIRSYIVGESTERRLATYRHLAEQTLAQRQQEQPRAPLPLALAHVPSEEPAPQPLPRRRFAPDARGHGRGNMTTFAAYVVLLGLVVVGMAWLLRSGLLPLGLGRW